MFHPAAEYRSNAEGLDEDRPHRRRSDLARSERSGEYSTFALSLSLAARAALASIAPGVVLGPACLAAGSPCWRAVPTRERAPYRRIRTGWFEHS
jgi:hypothetical protein